MCRISSVASRSVGAVLEMFSAPARADAVASALLLCSPCDGQISALLLCLLLQYISATLIQFFCLERSCYLVEPGQVKVVAIDTGASLVHLSPEDGGVVVATVKPDVTVQRDENLLVYQSTKQIRIAGGGFEDGMEASEVTTILPCCRNSSNVYQERMIFITKNWRNWKLLRYVTKRTRHMPF